MLSGTICALITPFTKDLEIDLPAFKSLVERQKEANVDGILLFGSTGEGAFLSSNERDQLLAIAKTIVQDQVQILVSVSHNYTETAINYAKRAKELGADCGLILPPFYVGANATEIEHHFLQVAESGLPLILYNNPARTNVAIAIDTIEELCLHPMIVGIKDCSQKISYCEQILKRTKLSVFSGDDAFSLPLCLLKGHGLISTICNAYPAEIKEMIDFALRADFSMARKIFTQFSSLLHVMQLDSNPKPIKYVMQRLHLCKMHVRRPLKDLHPMHQRKIDQVLETMDVKSTV